MWSQTPALKCSQWGLWLSTGKRSQLGEPGGQSSRFGPTAKGLSRKRKQLVTFCFQETETERVSKFSPVLPPPDCQVLVEGLKPQCGTPDSSGSWIWLLWLSWVRVGLLGAVRGHHPWLSCLGLDQWASSLPTGTELSLVSLDQKRKEVFCDFRERNIYYLGTKCARLFKK